MPINRQRGIRLNKFNALGSVYAQAPGGVAAAVRDNLIRKAQARLVAVNTTALTDNSAGVAGILFTGATTDVITLLNVAPNSLLSVDGPFQVSSVGGVLTGGPGVIIDDTTNTFTRDAGSWLTDGFVVGQTVTTSGAGDASNNVARVTTVLTTLVLTVASVTVAEGTQTDLVMTAPGILPVGLSAATDYWVKRTGDNTYTLYLTEAAALDPQSVAVDITTIGAGAHRLGAIGQPVALVSDDGAGDTDSFTAASGNTSFDLVMTAYATLVERAVIAAASIGAGTINDGPGSGGSGTIAAIDVDVAANSSDTTGTTFASAETIVTELLNGQKTVADYISVLRFAVGLGRVPEANNVLGAVDAVGVNGAGADITNAVTTTAVTILVSATEAGIEALLVVLADNIAFLADQLDEVTDIAVNAALGAYAA